MRILLFFLLAVTPALADNDPKPAAPTAAVPITYELRDLKPAGLTQYTASGDVIRQYFDFQTDQGSHHLIYEEVPNVPPARSVVSLRQMASAFDSQCSMDIECSAKAFCTGDCRHMYYEVSNAPGDPGSPDRNKCKILYFSCEKAAAAKPPSAPVAATQGK